MHAQDLHVRVPHLVDAGRCNALITRRNHNNLAIPSATFSSTSAATGRQLKQSVKVFQSLMLYRRLHSS